MPNSFEQGNGLNPNWPLGATGDLDSDRVSNLDEFTAVTAPNNPAFLLGDINRDGVVNFLDIGPFIAVLFAADFQNEADIDCNGFLNLLDIGPSIKILAGQTCAIMHQLFARFVVSQRFLESFGNWSVHRNSCRVALCYNALAIRPPRREELSSNRLAILVASDSESNHV